MPIIMPIEVQLPPTYETSKEFLQERVTRYAQALVDDVVANSRQHRQMTTAQVEANSISLEESKRRLEKKVRDFYHVEA